MQNTTPIRQNMIDYETIKSLEAVLSLEQICELLSDCNLEILSRVTQIENLITNLENPETRSSIRAIAHDLKGVSGNFGLTALSQAAASLQFYTTPPYAGDSETLEEQILQVILLGQESLNILEKKIADLHFVKTSKSF